MIRDRAQFRSNNFDPIRGYGGKQFRVIEATFCRLRDYLSRRPDQTEVDPIAVRTRDRGAGWGGEGGRDFRYEIENNTDPRGEVTK